MKRGIVYVATGQRYLEEACRSAESVRRHMPDIHMTVFSDCETSSTIFDAVEPAVDARHGLRDKITQMSRSPYELTVFLDTDTYVAADISPLFTLLEVFDLAAAHAHRRRPYLAHGIPESFPEFNAGVLAFRKTPVVDALFDRWLQLYDRDSQDESEFFKFRSCDKRNKGVNDQPSLRESVYQSTLRVSTLTPEYNCRITSLGYVHGKVKIFHGRHSDPEALARAMNRRATGRLYRMNGSRFEVLTR